MANASVAAPAGESGHTAPREVNCNTVRPFFRLAAEYQAAADASPDDLVADAACFTEAANAIVSFMAGELSETGSDAAANPRLVGCMLFGANYLSEMADGLVSLAREVRS